MRQDGSNTMQIERAPSVVVAMFLSGSFTFAYSLGVLVHEVGHVLGYQVYGIATKTFVFDPLGRSYIYPVVDFPEADLLVGASGSLFNVLCATLVLALLWKRQSLFSFPLLMWSATAYIQESIAILLDVMNGLPFDWAHVIDRGVPAPAIYFLSVVFLLIGCAVFLRLLAMLGLRPTDSLPRVSAICIGAISPFFFLSLIYVGFFMETDMDNWVTSKSISLGASIALSLCIALLFRPTYDAMNRFAPVREPTVALSHVGLSTVLAVVILVFGRNASF